MKVPNKLKITFVVVAMAMSSLAFAGEAAVTWQNPEKYTDIDSSNGSREKFQRELFKVLGGEFSKQAEKLPQGYKLLVNVTNLDLAGEMLIGPKGASTRVVKAINFPKMSFDYQLKDAAGAVVQEQKAVNVQDMSFYSSTSLARSSSDSYYFEKNLIRQWFKDDLLPKVK